MEERNISELRNEILDFFRYSITSDDNRSLLSIGSVTDAGRQILTKMKGSSFKNDEVEFILNPSDMKHIYKDHYGLNEKDPGNNIPLTDKDIMLIGDMLMNTSDIVYGIDKKTGRQLFFFLSKSSEGTYNLDEVYSNSNGNLNIKSLYNTKKGPSQRVMALMSALLPTSVTYSGSTLSSSAKLPIIIELHKDFEEKIPLERNFRIQQIASERGVSYRDLQKYIYLSIHNNEEAASMAFGEIISNFDNNHPNLEKGVVEKMMLCFKNDVDSLIDKHISIKKRTQKVAHPFFPWQPDHRGGCHGKKRVRPKSGFI